MRVASGGQASPNGHALNRDPSSEAPDIWAGKYDGEAVFCRETQLVAWSPE